MDQPRVRLQNCAVGRRSIGLETARTKCRLQSHRQKYARWVHRFGARHSFGHDRGDAMRAEPTRSERLQVRDRLRTDCDGDTNSAETFTNAEIDDEKIDGSLPHTTQLILTA